MGAEVQVAMLGPVEVLDDTGQLVSVGGPKERGVLAWLACSANRPVSMASLIDVVWGDDAPPTAVKTLQGYVSRLRGVLGAGASIERAGVGYKLVIDPAAVDVVRFESAIARGRTAAAAGDHQQAATVFADALALWRGDPLAELAGSPDADAKAVRLVELRATVTQERFAALIATGGGAELVADLEAAVTADPYREGLWAALMVALYRAGRQADALAAYQRARDRLVDDLGLEPGDDLRAVEAQVIAQDPALVPAGPPASVTGPPATSAGSAVVPGPGSVDGPVRDGAVDLSARSDLSWADSGRSVIFVGRDTELDRLVDSWDDTVASGGRWLVLVSGEAGIGKTRLAGELARHVAAAGGLVLHGRCDDGVAAPFQPFTEALGTWVRHTPLDRLRDHTDGQESLLARVVPAVADRLGTGGDPMAVPESDSEQHRTFEAFSDLLDGLGTTDDVGGAPVLLVIDDLHWAARPTLLLLHHLLRRPSRAPLLIVATYRGTDLTATTPLTDMLGTLHRTERVTTVALRGLDQAAVREFVELAADHQLDDTIAGFADTLCDQTGGNPFFIATVLAHLAETGAIVRRGERWEAAGDLTTVDLPEGVRRVVGLRLRQIDDTTVDALRTAAVIGSRFEIDLLATLTGHDTDALLDAMDQAAANGLITEAGGRWGTYRFAHDLVRATLVDDVSTTRRIRLHWRIAQALDTAATPDLDLLAFHAHEGVLAGDPATAAEMLRRAAVDADRRSAYDSAVTYATRGLDVLTDVDGHDQLRVDLLIDRAAAMVETGVAPEDPDFEDTCRQAEEAATLLGDHRRLVRALTLNERIYPVYAVGMIDQRRVEATRRAIHEPQFRDPGSQARLTAFLGHLLVWDNCVDERGALAESALKIIDRTPTIDPAIRVRTLYDCVHALWAQEHMARQHQIATSLMAETTDDSLADGFSSLTAVCLSALTVGDLNIGAFAEAQDAVDFYMQYAQDMELFGSRAMSTLMKLSCCAAYADLKGAAGAVARLDQPDSVPARARRVFRFAHFHHALVRAMWTGDESGVRALSATLRPGSAVAATLDTVDCYVALISDDIATARREWDGVRRCAPLDLVRGNTGPCTIAVLGDLTTVFGTDEERNAVYRELDRYQKLFGAHPGLVVGPIRLYLGKLDLALGRFDDAACHLDVAAEMCSSRGLDAWLARVDIQRARVALARGGEQRAAELLDGAAATGDAMGLPIIVREVAEVREQGH